MAHPIETLQPHGSGDFLSENIELRYVQEQEIVKSEPRYDRENGLQRFKHAFVMDNDVRYNATVIVPPEHAKAASQHLGHSESTAWLTGEYGMNERYQRNLAKIGLTAIIVSIPQNLGRLNTLTNDSLSQLAIHQELADIYYLDPHYFLGAGVSQSAMKNNGVVRFAPYYNSKSIFSNADVPCLPDGVSFDTAINALRHMPKNELSTVEEILEVPVAALIRYPRTVALKPFDVIRHLQALRGLTSGETGEHARNLPADTFMYVTGYKGDMLSQMEKWEEIYELYDNVIVDNLAGGGHLSCAGGPSHVNKLGRTKTVMEVIREDPTLIYMGGSALRLAAMERNPVFNKSVRTPTPSVINVD